MYWLSVSYSYEVGFVEFVMVVYAYFIFCHNGVGDTNSA